jgi:uncharacterized protein involved in exopolysaccharide biosynthesis
MSLNAVSSDRHLDLPQLEYSRSVSLLQMSATPPSRDVAALAFKLKFRLAAALLLPIICAVVLILVMPPSYRAQTSLVVGTGPEYLAQGDGTAAMTAPTSTKQEFINTEIELLNSLAVAKATIEHVGLETIYPKIAKAPPPASGSAMDTAIKAFKAALRVDPVKLSNLINVTFDHPNPKIASSVLDEFIARYQDLHATVFAGRRTRSYEETIGRDTQELEKLEHERTDVKAAGNIYDLTQQRSALILQRVDAERRLQDTVDNLTRLQERLAYLSKVRPQLSSEMKSVQTDPRAETIHARQMLFDLQQKQITLLGTYNADSPVVQRVETQITNLQRIMQKMEDTSSRVSLTPSPITTAIDQEIINSKAEVIPLEAQKERYRATIASIENQLQHIEQGDSKLRILDSHIDAQNENLRTMRRLYDQARAEDERELSKVTSVVQTSRAITLDKPVSPNKPLYLVAGVLAGLIAAAGVLILASLTNRTFISEESLERFLGLPVLGSVPLRAPNYQRLT